MPFKAKPGQSFIEYNGYIITYEINPIIIFVFEEISPNKYKKRRQIMGAFTKRHNYWGDKLYKAHATVKDGIDKAKAYIDEHIKPWSLSPHNRKSMNILQLIKDGKFKIIAYFTYPTG